MKVVKRGTTLSKLISSQFGHLKELIYCICGQAVYYFKRVFSVWCLVKYGSASEVFFLVFISERECCAKTRFSHAGGSPFTTTMVCAVFDAEVLSQ